MLANHGYLSSQTFSVLVYAPRRTHGIVENRTKGHPNNASAFSCIGPFRSSGDDVIEHLEHMVIVADLLGARRIVPVRSLVGDFFEHLSEVHVNSRVTFD